MGQSHALTLRAFIFGVNSRNNPRRTPGVVACGRPWDDKAQLGSALPSGDLSTTCCGEGNAPCGLCLPLASNHR